MSTTVARKRGPYAKSTATRQRAITAAIEIFGTTGYHGATLTDVAEKLGMTLTGLQHHFPDKDVLLAAVLEERDQAPQALESGAEHLEDLLEVVVVNEKNPRLTELFCVLSAEATDPKHPAHEYFVQRYQRQRESGSLFFRRLMDRGDLSSKADPDSLATLLIAVSDGLQLQWLLDPEALNMKNELRKYLQFAVPALARHSTTSDES